MKTDIPLRTLMRERPADLRTLLGIFAEPLMDSGRFTDLIGREQLMASDLITYLMGERVAELEQQWAAERTTLEAERAALEAEQADTLARLVEDAVIARFPSAPITLAAAIRQVRDPRRPQELHAAVPRAPDQASVERLLLAEA